jgi:hypothetical protein
MAGWESFCYEERETGLIYSIRFMYTSLSTQNLKTHSRVATHVLKSWPEFFNAISDGKKKHELRRTDRNFNVGDTVKLREYILQKNEYTGRELKARITYITSIESPCALSEEGLSSEFCILSISVLTKKLD